MKITDLMKREVLILDGGMGTLLQERGLVPGEPPEVWCLTQPDVITEIHRAYYEAGSHVVSTNTFGANPFRYDDAALEEIIFAAVACAKRARENANGIGERYIALDIGPCGRMLAPLGVLDFEEAVSAFAKIVRIGVRAGVDFVLIETMSDPYETKAALLAAKENCDLPIFVSNAFGNDGKLMTGADAAAMVALLEGMHADAIGVNCSFGPDVLSPVIDEYLDRASLPVMMKPNAGLPAVRDGKTVYDVSPEHFAVSLADCVRRGVRIVGGCCGTTPAYIASLVSHIKGIVPQPITEKNITCASSYTHAVTFGERPILIGERINPTGKRRLKEALLAEDMDYLLREGIAEEEAGADVLDVNVGLPGIDEKRLLTRAVCELQAVTDLPLQIDTSDPAAMESALRRYNGKAILNSVSGKQESMDAVFPLAVKYGGVIVALTLDEAGIPPTAEGRLAIARRILGEAEKYGISRKDILFDPLALTVSADAEAGNETLSALDLIRRELGCHTSLGVSNVSYGLPCREMINSTYFALALGRGLSGAIINPHSQDMMRVYHAYLALSGKDAQCREYIAYADGIGGQGTPPAPPREEITLARAIERGLRDEAHAISERLLIEKKKLPLDMIAEDIIPALDTVGAGYESGRIYLPQLLMSAEAARAAFDAIKAMPAPSDERARRLKIVLATVKGDIHDIGKNIVRLLLENYGFTVIDLGRDVQPSRVVGVALTVGAGLVGLSALMTTTVPAMEETIRRLRADAPHVKIVVGGAVLNAEYASAIGADKYARDAMETVRYAEELETHLP